MATKALVESVRRYAAINLVSPKMSAILDDLSKSIRVSGLVDSIKPPVTPEFKAAMDSFVKTASIGAEASRTLRLVAPAVRQAEEVVALSKLVTLPETQRFIDQVRARLPEITIVPPEVPELAPEGALSAREYWSVFVYIVVVMAGFLAVLRVLHPDADENDLATMLLTGFTVLGVHGTADAARRSTLKIAEKLDAATDD